jgi:acetyl-CoA carboxylase biotin carboxyl carrier protein
MTKSSSFNEDVVRQLAEILKETDLTEIEVEKEDCRIRVARQISVSQTIAAPPTFVNPTGPMPAPQAAQDLSAPALEIPIEKHPGAVKSPMVGNGYLSPAPGAAPFVRVGDQVKAGDTIVIIEAMKVMNQIKAPKDGTVKEILIHDGEPVEFDQVLLVIA